jgi:hypothetical protein
LALALNAHDSRIFPAVHAAKVWPHDRDVPLMLKAAVTPLTTADEPAVSTFTIAFLDHMAPVSAAADLLGRGLRLRFDQGAAIRVPGFFADDVDMTFVGEGQPIPVLGPLPGSGAVLERRKLACIVEASAELLNSGNAEELLRQLLVDATAPALDRAMLSTVPAGPERPAGLLAGIAPLASTGDLAADLVRLIAAVSQVAGNARVVIVGAPDQTAAIAFVPRAPWPVITSASLPQGTLIVLATPALASATEGAPRVDASTVATIHEQSGPSQIITDTGVVAHPVRSMFQTDVVSLRVRLPVSWALRDERGIAWMVRP